MRQTVTQTRDEGLDHPWYAALPCSVCRLRRIGSAGIFLTSNIVLCPICATFARELIDIGLRAQ